MDPAYSVNPCQSNKLRSRPPNKIGPTGQAKVFGKGPQQGFMNAHGPHQGLAPHQPMPPHH